eukprot:GEMP01002043.1.p1 GENE.GEMP01002043.1~~GEMP01002043.1.p1  ORF type:complete len:1128 (+),score=160.28 GEMP01002043.1:360-3743(+)
MNLHIYLFFPLFVRHAWCSSTPTTCTQGQTCSASSGEQCNCSDTGDCNLTTEFCDSNNAIVALSSDNQLAKGQSATTQRKYCVESAISVGSTTKGKKVATCTSSTVCNPFVSTATEDVGATASHMCVLSANVVAHDTAASGSKVVCLTANGAYTCLIGQGCREDGTNHASACRGGACSKNFTCSSDTPCTCEETNDCNASSLFCDTDTKIVNVSANQVAAQNRATSSNRYCVQNVIDRAEWQKVATCSTAAVCNSKGSDNNSEDARPTAMCITASSVILDRQPSSGNTAICLTFVGAFVCGAGDVCHVSGNTQSTACRGVATGDSCGGEPGTAPLNCASLTATCTNAWAPCKLSDSGIDCLCRAGVDTMGACGGTSGAVPLACNSPMTNCLKLDSTGSGLVPCERADVESSCTCRVGIHTGGVCGGGSNAGAPLPCAANNGVCLKKTTTPQMRYEPCVNGLDPSACTCATVAQTGSDCFISNEEEGSQSSVICAAAEANCLNDALNGTCIPASTATGACKCHAGVHTGGQCQKGASLKPRNCADVHAQCLQQDESAPCEDQTICTCQRVCAAAVAHQGYQTVAAPLPVSRFPVNVTCADGYAALTGSPPMATACTTPGGPYTMAGCMPLCSFNVLCNNTNPCACKGTTTNICNLQTMLCHAPYHPPRGDSPIDLVNVTTRSIPSAQNNYLVAGESGDGEKGNPSGRVCVQDVFSPQSNASNLSGRVVAFCGEDDICNPQGGILHITGDLSSLCIRRNYVLANRTLAFAGLKFCVAFASSGQVTYRQIYECAEGYVCSTVGTNHDSACMTPPRCDNGTAVTVDCTCGTMLCRPDKHAFCSSMSACVHKSMAGSSGSTCILSDAQSIPVGADCVCHEALCIADQYCTSKGKCIAQSATCAPSITPIPTGGDCICNGLPCVAGNHCTLEPRHTESQCIPPINCPTASNGCPASAVKIRQVSGMAQLLHRFVCPFVSSLDGTRTSGFEIERTTFSTAQYDYCCDTATLIPNMTIPYCRSCARNNDCDGDAREVCNEYQECVSMDSEAGIALRADTEETLSDSKTNVIIMLPIAGTLVLLMILSCAFILTRKLGTNAEKETTPGFGNSKEKKKVKTKKGLKFEEFDLDVAGE